MIKITCDRCNREINNHYYTININSYDDIRIKLPISNYYNEANTNIVLNKYREERMYCEKCIKEIKIFTGED